MNAEKQVGQLRAEISKRMVETSQLRQRGDAHMASGDMDQGITLNSRAGETERAVAHLKDKLGQLLPGLAEGRVRAALPEIEGRVVAAKRAHLEEQQQAEQDFLAFFRAWNKLLETGLGKKVAEQLLGNFGKAVMSAATDNIFRLALTQRREVMDLRVDREVSEQRAALRELIQREVAALANVEIATKEEVPA